MLESELNNIGERVLRAWSDSGTMAVGNSFGALNLKGPGDEPGDLEGLPLQWSTEGPSRSQFLEAGEGSQ